jgi:16S rRNA (cytosine967-C5)-methyltransferase
LIARISPARRIAFDALTMVACGGYASDALRELAAALDARNAGLAAQIVFGCLRYQAQLDYLIAHYSGRRTRDLDESVRIALRMGIFQLRYLDRVPSHAAVHESVELVKHHRRAAAGLANAVLRKVNRDPVEWPDEATEFSVPQWLLERWEAHFGAGRARTVARAALEEPQRYVRIPPGLPPPASVVLEPAGVEGAFRLHSPTAAGIRLHDIGSQSIIPLLDLQPRHTYLDLCAAPGNKTLQALETGLSLAIACDISEKRIREIPRACPRVVLDATQPLPFSRPFDRIFIDAPCSGTGTIARNPEIKWRVEPRDFARLGQKQGQILEQAIPLLHPAGKLVYATCSLEREENEDVVQKVLAEHAGLRVERTLWRLPGIDEGDGFFAAVFVSGSASA